MNAQTSRRALKGRATQPEMLGGLACALRFDDCLQSALVSGFHDGIVLLIHGASEQQNSLFCQALDVCLARLALL